MTNQNNAAQAAPQQTVLTREQIGELYKDWVCVFGVSTGSAELCIREIEAAVLSQLRAPVADDLVASLHSMASVAPTSECEILLAAASALASAPVTHYECGRSNGDGSGVALPVAGEAPGTNRQGLLEAIHRYGNARAMAEHNIAYRDEVRKTAGALVALFDAAPQASAAPVAFSKDGVLFWYGDHAARRGFNGDLYLAPQASEAVRNAALEEAHNLALAQAIHAVSGMWVEDVTLPEVITAIHAINLHSAKATVDLTLPPLPPADLMSYPGGSEWPFPKVAYFNAASMAAYARAALSAQPGAQRTGGSDAG